MERPATCISMADPRTTKRAAAIITSRAPVRAMTWKSGVSRKRPARIVTMMAPIERAALMSGECPSPPPLPPRIDTMASKGTMAMSCSSRIEKERWPCRLFISLLSLSICKAKAVDESARPKPATSPPRQSVSPVRMQTPVSARPVTTTWAVPSPNMSWRMCQRRVGFSSRPIMNSRKTTPSSATARMSPVPVMMCAIGPITTPAAR